MNQNEVETDRKVMNHGRCETDNATMEWELDLS